MIVWGTRLFGEVDQVPGLFSVRTRFAHIYYVPLVPTASFLMLGPERGIELSQIQMRSVLACWIRAVLMVGGVVAVLTGLTQLNGPEASHTGGILALVTGALCLGAFFGSYRWLRANKERALALCSLARLPADVQVRIERHFQEIASGGKEIF